MFRLVAAAGLLIWSSVAPADNAGATGVVKEVKDTISAWVSAFNAPDARRVVCAGCGFLGNRVADNSCDTEQGDRIIQCFGHSQSKHAH